MKKVKIKFTNLKIVIENLKGSYKDFEIENDSVWHAYPLKGITYPVDYGYIEGYYGEDGAELDVFVGSGDKNGYIKIWRLDVLEETKFFIQLTKKEFKKVLITFKPVLLGHKILKDKAFFEKIEKFKRK